MNNKPRIKLIDRREQYYKRLAVFYGSISSFTGLNLISHGREALIEAERLRCTCSPSEYRSRIGMLQINATKKDSIK